MKKDFELIKKLNFTREDIENFAEYFSIVHHSSGRIRLRANLKLKNLLDKVGGDELNNFFEEAKALPMIKNIKINKLIGSVTIEYDDKSFEPNLWDLWLRKKDSALVYDKIYNLIKGL